MIAPLSWLKHYVDIDIPAEELQAKLFSCGFEVEELIEVGKDISGVVVGEVIECSPVEGTHLSLCKVDCGDKGVFQICCGADNVKKGIKAPCALVGATVYATAKDHVTIEGVMTIKKGKLRGIESDGMLCSGAELGLNEDLYDGAGYCGLLLLPADCKNGADVKPILGLDDYLFDISVTANRPDCQSIYGIAREVAAVLGKKIREPEIDYKTVKTDAKININIDKDAESVCPRYIGHYVKDVKCAPSPLWLRQRLAKCGLRSISNVVDITNYVLLELGQPMHAFDLRTLDGREINVRRAKKGEKIITLDENEFELTTENLVICDGKKPVAIAGVMGGLNSEIKDDTTEVLFESAKFARDSVRKTARALGQHTDSSALFEKGVNEYTTERAIARALHLIQELKCGTVTDFHRDVKTKYSHTAERQMIVNADKINALLGIDVPLKRTVEILERLNFKVELKGKDLNLTVPGYREDIDGYPDIAEEIIRFYGYENIEGTFLPSASITNGGYSDEQKAELRLKDALVSKGLYEISTYSFYSQKDLNMMHFAPDAKEREAIRILNPISEDLSIMRTTLAPSMLNVIVRNLRRGNMEGKLFEISNVYLPRELPIKSFPEEKPVISIGVWGKYDFFDIKGIVESIGSTLNTKFEFEPCEKSFLHPGISAKVLCDGVEVGYLGMISPEISDELALERLAYVAELDYAELKKHENAFKYVPLPKYAEVTRDLALICNADTPCAEIKKEIYSACKYVSNVYLFDVYVGEQVGKGKKSMAFTVTFTPNDEPIENKIDGFVKKILGNLKFKLDISLR
ncbi:MAG: phenylalanine--tRNA ligase subunit beta [Clostridia bacterium]|nr:phenylalanine--tRNA ligase subunit beta [Clostridia bacterium]